jgi:hypothetical protein
MKKIVIPLLGTICVLLLINSTESVGADHLEPGEGIFKNENQINLVSIKDSKYQVYMQIEVRNAQGQLISITETTHVKHIPHEITDDVFDTLMGEKEIVTIDDIKYEKVQYVGMHDIEQLIQPFNRPSHYIGNWFIFTCQDIDNHGYGCITPWQANSDFVSLEEDDTVKNYWTILRIIN